MKLTIFKWVLIASIYALSVKSVGAQTTVKLEGGVYTSVTKARTSEPAKDTGKVYQDGKGVKYPIYQSAGGAYFVIRTSQKTGKTYKQYLKI